MPLKISDPFSHDVPPSEKAEAALRRIISTASWNSKFQRIQLSHPDYWNNTIKTSEWMSLYYSAVTIDIIKDEVAASHTHKALINHIGNALRGVLRNKLRKWMDVRAVKLRETVLTTDEVREIGDRLNDFCGSWNKLGKNPKIDWAKDLSKDVLIRIQDPRDSFLGNFVERRVPLQKYRVCLVLKHEARVALMNRAFEDFYPGSGAAWMSTVGVKELYRNNATFGVF